MEEKLTYADLPDEDKLLMDGLFQIKIKAIIERKKVRNELALLRKREMELTKEIMNLSQKAIGEKFELGCNSAKPLSKTLRRELNKKVNPVDSEPVLFCGGEKAFLSFEKAVGQN